MGIRDMQYDLFNISSNNATLLPYDKRTKKVSAKGTANIWYGNKETIEDVLEYIDTYDTNNENFIYRIDNTNTITGAEINIISKARINQGYFRDLLLTKYKKCCLCGVSNKDFLIASHIKPWRASSKKEKVDIKNGLLLCPAHDRLFDKGYISFDDNGYILISEKLDQANRIFLNVSPDIKIDINERNIEFIRYHRDKLFICESVKKSL